MPPPNPHHAPDTHWVGVTPLQVFTSQAIRVTDESLLPPRLGRPARRPTPVQEPTNGEPSPEQPGQPEAPPPRSGE